MPQSCPYLIPRLISWGRTSWGILVWLSLGSTSLTAWAEDPPCPSQAQAVPPQSAATPAPATPRSEKDVANGGKFDVEAEDVSYDVHGNATAKGNVEVRQGDREIRADQIQYDIEHNSVKTQGGMDYSDPVVHVAGEGGSYSPETGADFQSAQFELRQRAARGSAKTMQLTPEGIIHLDGVSFTTCPARDQSWALSADSITLDTRTKLGYGRDARIDFKGVPILYLPWVSFPLGTERKSGFLFPTIGNSSRSGFQLSVPYYFNIAPNADFTFQPMEYSRRGIDLGGDLRYMTRDSHTELIWNYLPNDTALAGEVAGIVPPSDIDTTRSRVKLTNLTELPGDFRLSVDAENVSDVRYFQDFSQGPEGASTAFLDRRATLSYRDEHWRIDGEAQQYQTLDLETLGLSNLASSSRPYARVPRLAAAADYGWGPEELVRYGFDSEIVNFQRNVGPTGWRVDAMPGASLNFDGPGYFMHPAFAWRATWYQLSGDLAPGQDRSPSRILPIASFDTGLKFERQTGSHNQRTLTLEPRLLYLYVPYRNQNDIPVFDTAVPDLNPVELFRTNRYVGADRVSDADQVSLGVTSRLLDAHNGRQFLAATIGQAYYFETPRVTLPGEAPTAGKRSDFVAQLALTAFQNWGADLALQWNPQTSSSERTYVSVQYKPAPDEVINVGYRFERNLLEQAEVSGAWPIARNWNVFARGVYSLKDDKALERFVGFEYRACCWRVRFGARRYVTTFTGAQDTGAWLQLELTGLASVGSASDTFLTEAIRGYAPLETTRIGGPIAGP